MQTLFDGYLIVDWSANNRPKTGKDSIWWCLTEWQAGSLVIRDVQNPATRQLALQQILSILLQYLNTNKRILLGFDFSYAYPSGFAEAMVLEEMPAWLAIWRYMFTHVKDGPSNNNNRFDVATQMNMHLSAGPAPFWGCPERLQNTYLSMKKPKGRQANLFAEYRLAEQGNRTHSTWKLSYAGAVGSQTLTGLPYLYRLRTDTRLQDVSKVWPFETGLRTITHDDLRGVHILHAEIYPSLVSPVYGETEIKDAAQVQALAMYFADLDYQAMLGRLFAGIRVLSEQERSIIENEEGWILGI